MPVSLLSLGKVVAIQGSAASLGNQLGRLCAYRKNMEYLGQTTGHKCLRTSKLAKG